MTDRLTVLAVVVLLGAFALVGLTGTIYLVNNGKDASSVAIVAGMTGTALGALGAMLASTRTAPAPVNVVNTPDQPVPVDPAP